MRVGLIVTTYEWPAALDLCLRSIARQSHPPDEIVIADDGSGPETAALVAGWDSCLSAPLTHSWQPHEGFRLARSRNRAIAASHSDYLIFVDGDMVLHRHFIADHWHAAQAGVFIQGARLLTNAALAGKMLRDHRLDLGFFTRGISRRHHTIRSRALSRLARRDRTDQRFVRGCNQGYWRRDLVQVNGFNEAFAGWGREDNEIAARLYHLGRVRRMLKFQALAIHLYHPPRMPVGENPNDGILRQTIAHRLVVCERGLAQN